MLCMLNMICLSLDTVCVLCINSSVQKFEVNKINTNEPLYFLNQGFSALALEIHFHAEFSSNPDQTHLNKLTKVFRISRNKPN